MKKPIHLMPIEEIMFLVSLGVKPKVHKTQFQEFGRFLHKTNLNFLSFDRIIDERTTSPYIFNKFSKKQIMHKSVFGWEGALQSARGQGKRRILTDEFLENFMQNTVMGTIHDSSIS